MLLLTQSPGVHLVLLPALAAMLGPELNLAGGGAAAASPPGEKEAAPALPSPGAGP